MGLMCICMYVDYNLLLNNFEYAFLLFDLSGRSFRFECVCENAVTMNKGAILFNNLEAFNCLLFSFNSNIEKQI